MSKAPDPNVEAARLVAKSKGEDEPLPAELEAAWEAWIKGVQDIDMRTRTLLRAAFEAGYDVGVSAQTTEAARQSGQKGGAARAEKLTAEQRSAIAKKAAATRWRNSDPD